MFSELRSIPYWRLSSFYFFNCAVLGAVLPYWGLYLRELGFSGAQIGAVAALLMATNIVAPNLWGWLSDHTGRRLFIIRVGTLLACLSFAGLFCVDSFAPIALLTACYSFCWQGLNSQFEVITLGHLHGKTAYYGHIRLWGSVGFVGAVASLGAIFDAISIHYLPWFIFGFLLSTWVSTLLVDARAVSTARASRRGLGAILTAPAVRGLLLAVALLQLSHGAYYTFYTLYLDGFGYSGTTIGALWSLAVIAELSMFLIMYKLMPRLGPRKLLLASLAMAAARWTAIAGMPDSLIALTLAQLLHAFTYSAAHVAVIELIREHFGARHQGRGQALYSSLCVGGGGALGAMVSGELWEWSPAGAFALAAITAALGFVIAWRRVALE